MLPSFVIPAASVKERLLATKDSRRFFVLRVPDERHKSPFDGKFLGIGFAERIDAFEFEEAFKTSSGEGKHSTKVKKWAQGFERNKRGTKRGEGEKEGEEGGDGEGEGGTVHKPKESKSAGKLPSSRIRGGSVKDNISTTTPTATKTRKTSIFYRGREVATILAAAQSEQQGNEGGFERTIEDDEAAGDELEEVEEKGGDEGGGGDEGEASYEQEEEREEEEEDSDEGEAEGQGGPQVRKEPFERAISNESTRNVKVAKPHPRLSKSRSLSKYSVKFIGKNM